MPFVGTPASLGPGLRTVSGAQWSSAGFVPARTTNSMPTAASPKKVTKADLAFALARGTPIARWALKNDVDLRIAYRWAADPKVKKRVEDYHRQILTEAVGVFAANATWAADQVATLAENAKGESVKLAALRSIQSDMITASRHAGLEGRLREIEEKLRGKPGNPDRAS
jgi:hypothetical protein